MNIPFPFIAFCINNVIVLRERTLRCMQRLFTFTSSIDFSESEWQHRKKNPKGKADNDLLFRGDKVNLLVLKKVQRITQPEFLISPGLNGNYMEKGNEEKNKKGQCVHRLTGECFET